MPITLSEVIEAELPAGMLRYYASLAAGIQAEERRRSPLGFDTLVRRDPIGVESQRGRSEEHTSELQSLMRISYAVFCLKKKKTYNKEKQKKNNTKPQTTCTNI